MKINRPFFSIVGIIVAFFVTGYAIYFFNNQQVFEHKFVIIIPSYNNKDWFRYNLNSVFAQTYPHYRVIYIDDCSPDGTYDLVKNYVTENNVQGKVTLIGNTQRKGALANHYTAIHMCQDDEIIVCLDGDDWFANDTVLHYLSRVYRDSSVWLAYSQFCNWPTGEMGWSEAIPNDVIISNEFRKFGFVSPQLRTYYAWLAKLVKLEDLIWDDTRDFFPVSGDVALMFPMLEMAAYHFKFLPKVLCQRNVATPLNDFKTQPDLQVFILDLISAKTPYIPLRDKKYEAIKI